MQGLKYLLHGPLQKKYANSNICILTVKNWKYFKVPFKKVVYTRKSEILGYKSNKTCAGSL